MAKHVGSIPLLKFPFLSQAISIKMYPGLHEKEQLLLSDPVPQLICPFCGAGHTIYAYNKKFIPNQCECAVFQYDQDLHSTTQFM